MLGYRFVGRTQGGKRRATYIVHKNKRVVMFANDSPKQAETRDGLWVHISNISYSKLGGGGAGWAGQGSNWLNKRYTAKQMKC